MSSAPSGRRPGEARTADRRVSGSHPRRDRDLGARQRLRGARDRLLAVERERASPLRGRRPRRCPRFQRERGAEAPGSLRPGDLIARVLPEQPRPRRGHQAGRQRSPSSRSRGGPAARGGDGRHLRRSRSAALGRREPRRLQACMAASRAACARAWCPDRDRELPDDLLGRRVARRAQSPALWRQMFEIIPDENFGLNFDPSHLVWQFIDYTRAVREFAPRIFHVHAKDMEIDRDRLYDEGVMSLGLGWQVPRLPGLGEVRWDRFISALYAIGYDWVVSIEHEDRNFEGELELVQRGFLLARNTLRPLVV